MCRKARFLRDKRDGLHFHDTPPENFSVSSDLFLRSLRVSGFDFDLRMLKAREAGFPRVLLQSVSRTNMRGQALVHREVHGGARGRGQLFVVSYSHRVPSLARCILPPEHIIGIVAPSP